MVGAGKTETRPRSVMRPIFTEGSARDQSARANRGSSTPVAFLKSEMMGHTVMLLFSSDPQVLQNFAGADILALQCVQRTSFTNLRCLSGGAFAILS